MADTTVKIGDVSAQLTKASRLAVSTDSFWVQTGGDSAGNGQSVLIPAELIRAYLVENVSPTVGDNGDWYVNGKDLGIKAEGATPKLRGGTYGIEVSTDGGTTWTEVVPYTSIAPQGVKMVALSQDDYDALVAAGTIDADTYYNILEEE